MVALMEGPKDKQEMEDSLKTYTRLSLAGALQIQQRKRYIRCPLSKQHSYGSTNSNDCNMTKYMQGMEGGK